MKVPLPYRDREFLSFALNLEFLQAEFYIRAVTGEGLNSQERGFSDAPCVGGRKIYFENPFVAAIAEEFCRGQRSHISLLQSLIVSVDGVPQGAPAIDLATSFNAVMTASGLGQPDRIFDAFTNDTNFVLAAYMIEDVVVSAYRGAISTISDSILRDHIAGIMAAEASQSGIIRTILFALGLGDPTNAISYTRQVLSQVEGTGDAGNDHGVGSPSFSGIVNADGNYAIWPRSEQQILNIVYGGIDRRSGLFYPEGLKDADRHTIVREIFGAQLESLSLNRGAPIVLLSSVPSEVVEMPPLDLSEALRAGCNIRENVSHQPWSQNSYRSHAPSVIEIADAVSHGAVGIITVDDRVIHETMWHTDPCRHQYYREGDEIVLKHAREEFVAGTTVSILVGAAESYWHSMLDATARLLLVQDSIWERVNTLLIPSTGIRQTESVELYGVPAHVAIRSIEPGAILRLEALIYPTSIHGLFDYQPTILNRFYDRLLANTSASDKITPQYVFLDRRNSPLRKLLNENDLIAALPEFEPVLLEELGLLDQIRLFANAKIIVAPHGAGLTNIGFCKLGTVIVELMMDAYCNWCYRRIAAVRSLVYHCVIGKSTGPWDPARSIHIETWHVALEDVLEIVSRFT